MKITSQLHPYQNSVANIVHNKMPKILEMLSQPRGIHERDIETFQVDNFSEKVRN